MDAVEVSRRFSRRVFEDALEAVQERNHPCHHFVQWQEEQDDYRAFQLPEPFSGRWSILKLAFIGLNPSFTGAEVMPCYQPGVEFDHYDDFFRSRFDLAIRNARRRPVIRFEHGAAKEVHLWNRIENFGNHFLTDICGGTFHLGEHALLLEAIRYKSRHGWLGRDSEEVRKMIEHQASFTRDVLDEAGFTVLVPNGKHAWDQLKGVLEFEQAVPPRITSAMGNSYHAQTPSGTPVTVCPITHMSQALSKENARAVAEEIRKALDK
jgi:hypothetical protein